MKKKIISKILRKATTMNKKIPMRQCVGCGEMKTKKDMFRVIKTAEETEVKTPRKRSRVEED